MAIPKERIGLFILGGAILLAAISSNKQLDRKSLDYLPEATGVVIFSSEDESKKAIQEINSIRKAYGKPPINYSSKAYNLAVARAKDMNEYRYYDHTNPKTKTCADTMKFDYGFTSSDYLAENINTYVNTGGGAALSVQTMSDSIKGWMNSRGHRYNLLFDMHVAGAVGCDGNKCVFLGLNAEKFGEGCHTAKEGNEYWDTAKPQSGEIVR
ncbi:MULTISPECIES: CAP domain-containing protein [Pseudanabaena]|uniref:SCP-like extracellular n=2 Tax=Pseudanabaena TaxID=1152 RepID=L8N240_9CYAN|nr:MULTISPECIES: CAP domain-containing protein [Pseudanabaena]ELS32795.1 SCP-like extracellular [Pseudanabaena biceps PCC 7429]MDG3494982.1 CAP domain-containing protein [Pseudanabaena catenata USMAC16]